MLYKEKRNGADYIRIEYADSEAVGILLSQDAEKTGENSACIPAAAFRLPDFYDRYSPHAYIDYSRVWVCRNPGGDENNRYSEGKSPLNHYLRRRKPMDIEICLPTGMKYWKRLCGYSQR